MIGKIILVTGIALFCLFPAVALLEFILKLFRRNRNGYYKLGFNITELFFAVLIQAASLGAVALLVWIYRTFFPAQVLPALLLAPVALALLLYAILFLNHLLPELRRNVLYDPERQVILVEQARRRIHIDLRDPQWQVVCYAARYRKLGKMNIPGATLGKTVLTKGRERVTISHLVLQYHDLYRVCRQRPHTKQVYRQITFVR